jgi:hypothetical protein
MRDVDGDLQLVTNSLPTPRPRHNITRQTRELPSTRKRKWKKKIARQQVHQK